MPKPPVLQEQITDFGIGRNDHARNEWRMPKWRQAPSGSIFAPSAAAQTLENGMSFGTAAARRAWCRRTASRYPSVGLRANFA